MISSGTRPVVGLTGAGWRWAGTAPGSATPRAPGLRPRMARRATGLSRRRVAKGWPAKLLRRRTLMAPSPVRIQFLPTPLMALLREKVKSPATRTRALATRYPMPWMLPLILKSRTTPRSPVILATLRILAIWKSLIPRSLMPSRMLAARRARVNRGEQAVSPWEPAIAYPFFRWLSLPLPRWWLRYGHDIVAVSGCSAPCRSHRALK